MRLPPQETERFYRIWFALLHYVNRELHVVPAFPDAPGKEDVSVEVTLKVRDALWATDALRERFIIGNPAQLSGADLALVASWQYRLAGAFYIFRSLQHSTIFLSETTPAHAYGVLGLVSSIEETVPLPLPVYMQAVLLPFEHHIIYDSLLTSYNVLFGSGYRQDLQELYRNIQEREGIITSLLPEDQAAREAKGVFHATFPGANLIHRVGWKYLSWLHGYSGGLLRMPQMRLNPNQMRALRTGLAQSKFELPENDDAFYAGRLPVESDRGLALAGAKR